MRYGSFVPHRDILLGFGFYLCLGATLAVYWPGLSGSFLLDDFPNIGALGDYRYFDTGDRLIAFVLSGNAGPLGRPLSLLSFLLNDFAWPSDPESFLYTNILIHLLNGCLVFWFIYLLTQKIGRLTRVQSLFVSLLAATVWLLHPLNVSTVLYVVQRMTELSSLFMLTALVCYLQGRHRLSRTPAAGYVLMSAGMAIGLGLGALSKETAATLPLYVLALEHTILRSGPGNAGKRPALPWNVAFVYLPLGAVLGWHLLRFDSYSRAYELRPFEIGERLLTEPRILIDYLVNIVVPKRAGTGLFHDDFALSSSLLDPVATLLAVVFLAAALIAAVRFRHQWPSAAFAALWFLGGHAFEAGILPLELYFEHRNYLPMLGPVFGLAVFFVWLGTTRLRPLGTAAGALFVLLTAAAAWQNTSLWGNPALLGDVWAAEHPGSPRAQQFSAHQWSIRGQTEKARERVARLLELKPRATSAHLIRVQLNCLLEEPVRRSDIERLRKHLARGDRDTAIPETIQKILNIKRGGGCPGLGYDDIETMITTLLGNDNFGRGRLRRNLFIVQGELATARRNFDTAVRSLHAAFDIESELSTALLLVNVLASGGLYEEALAVLEDPGIEASGILYPKLPSREKTIKELKDRIRNAIKYNQIQSEND